MNGFAFCLSALIFLTAGKGFAQCPVVLHCSAPTDTLCDASSNDSLLWNGSSFWDTLYQLHDLPEVPADLQLSVVDTCAGGVPVRFLLFLDLDGNGSLESVLDSDSLPPPAQVWYNNAANPGYAADSALVFDTRPVPAAEQHRFVLQQTQHGDTLLAAVRWTSDANPGVYSIPELPGRKFKIIWSIGLPGAVDTCTHLAAVSDCRAPEVYCLNNFSTMLSPSGFATIWATDLVGSATDDKTPPDLLQFAIRRTGDGVGFPLDALGNPLPEAFFNCCELGPQMVELWVKDVAGNTGFCSTYVEIQDVFGNCDCNSESLYACAETFADSSKIDDLLFNFVNGATHLFAHPLTGGCAEFDGVLHAGDSYHLTAYKNDHPLNGVSTFDLVLISKHILGLEPFDATWKWLAADANNSNSVTTFDVVELRKLILGIYDTLPGNTSWGFVPDEYVFPDPANPFAFPVPGNLSVDSFPSTGRAEHILYGYKVGDVNGTALPSDYRPAPDYRQAATLTLPDLSFVPGETFEVAVQAGEAASWLGLQFALQFDPKTVEITQVIPGVLQGLDEAAWSLDRPGLLHFSWFNAVPQVVMRDENLFRLRIRARDAGRLKDVLSFSTERLKPEAYDHGNHSSGLQLHYTAQDFNGGASILLTPQPNPTTAVTQFPLRLAAAETAILAITEVSGKVVYQVEKALERGNQLIDVPASAFPSAGIYFWTLKIGTELHSGRLVRQ